MKQIFSLTAALLLTLTMTAQMPMGGSGGSQAKDVSDAELKKFAKTMDAVQQMQKQYQQKMVQAVKSSGISVQKFQTIAQSQSNPKKKSQASEAELKKFKSAQKEVKKVRQNMQSDIQSKMKENGFSRQRFQQVYKQVRQDKELQQKVQSYRNSGQGQGAPQPGGGR